MRKGSKVASPLVSPILRMLHGFAGQGIYDFDWQAKRLSWQCQGDARAVLRAVFMTVCALPAAGCIDA